MLIGVPNKPGIAAKVFARVARHNIVVDDIIQNIYEHGREANIGFTTTHGDAAEAVAICEEMAADVGIKAVEVDEKVAKVSIVGIGMRSHTGVAARMFTALAEGQVNIQHISTSEIMVSCIVHEDDGERALQVLHAAFELDKNNE